VTKGSSPVGTVTLVPMLFLFVSCLCFWTNTN